MYTKCRYRGAHGWEYKMFSDFFLICAVEGEYLTYSVQRTYRTRAHLKTSTRLMLKKNDTR